MAKCGFYEIRTFETLSRDFSVTHTHFESLLKKPEELVKEEDTGNKRQQKQKDKG